MTSVSLLQTLQARIQSGATKMGAGFSEQQHFLAHSANEAGYDESVKAHLSLVAVRARSFASDLEMEEDAFLAGLFHDLGKYGDLFQLRLLNKVRRINHWSAGAWCLVRRYKEAGILPALVIEGHHLGLQSGAKRSIKAIDPAVQAESPNLVFRPSEPDVSVLERRFLADGLSFPEPPTTAGTIQLDVDSMLDTRMLFSALVDADFIETAAHFKGGPEGPLYLRPPSATLEPAEGLEHLIGYLEALNRSTDASETVLRIRATLLSDCLQAAVQDPGLFTLTAPTGSGKTLSLLAFALKHAAENDLKRIVVVIPYLTIIEQTAGAYRTALSGSRLATNILEHHSLAGMADDDRRGDSDTPSPDQLLAENWDSPIVVTTSVQFLNSLFSNRSSACRKLHNIARSVVIFDEVQTLPLHLALPTLATLSRLTERFSTSVVFSTATQPAFGKLDELVRPLCGNGWSPREITSDTSELFSSAMRVKTTWPGEASPCVSFDELAEKILDGGSRQALCIFNVKRHALEVFRRIRASGAQGVFHLSTSMCPAHRIKVLDQVRERLLDGRDCRLVATQCVEAGVDLDFPSVYRAWGPLDSIAQAGGRCNRNGNREYGELHVFELDDSAGRLYPDGSYQRASTVAKMLFREQGDPNLGIDDPEVFHRYFEMLYNVSELETLNPELLDAMQGLDFVEVARRYQVIEKRAIDVLVPFDQAAFDDLASRARASGLNRSWITDARAHSVSIFRPRPTDIVLGYLEPVPTRQGPSEYWFIYLNGEDYDPDAGLRLPDSTDCLIG